MMTQEIMRQIRRRRGAVRGRGEEAAVSFGPTPAPPDVAPPLRCRNSPPGALSHPGGHGSAGLGRGFNPVPPSAGDGGLQGSG